MLLVSVPMRMQGVGTALLEAFRNAALEKGAHTLRVSPASPVPISWYLSRERCFHPCLPGVPKLSVGRSWLKHKGFSDHGMSLVMWRRLSRNKSGASAVTLKP